MSGFDHHDPEVEALMRARALEQGRAFNAQTLLRTQARTHGGPVPIAAEAGDFEALRAALKRFIDELGAVLDRFNEAMQQIGDAFSKLLEQIEAPTNRHGHAAVCPRHGPTKGGTCTACAVSPPAFQRLPMLPPPPRPLVWKGRSR